METGSPSTVNHEASCVDGVNQRTITCASGYFADGDGQVSPDANIVIVGLASYSGCTGMLLLYHQR